MKTSILFKLAFVAVCIFSLSSMTAKAEKIVDPGGLQWVVMDAETADKIPYTDGASGEYVLKTAPWASGQTSIVNNPEKTGYHNQTEKSLLWVKGNIDGQGAWGSVGIELMNGSDYWDLSAWEKVTVDVMVEDYPITQYKIDLYSAAGNVGGVEVYGSGEPEYEWTPLSISLSELVKDGNAVHLTSADRVNQIKIFVNGGNGNIMNVYLDNLRFTRTLAPSGLKENKVANFKIYPNPAVESIQIEGATGAISVYNMFGMEMYYTANYNGENISVAGFTSGIYFVKYNGLTAKFTKE